MICGGGAPYACKYYCYQHNEVNNHTYVERHAKVVGKEPLKPTTYLHNAWHYAIKHSSSGEIKLCVDEEKERYTLSVVNPGSIDEADITHIFERFYKADRAHSGEGTGLGLAIAREIMELMGEKIWAESANGEVKFCFTIKKQQANANNM